MIFPAFFLAAMRTPLEIIGAFIFAAVASIVLVAKVLTWWFSSQPEGPKLAGSTIPELNEGLDLTKRYDIAYGGDSRSSFVEKLNAVLIVGYVGGDNEASKMYMQGRWLALESEDGLRSYVMPHAIISLQETPSGS